MEQNTNKYYLTTDPNEVYYFGTKIFVKVVNPTQVKKALLNHIVYTISGNDLTGTFETIRRYSDFDIVRNLMIKHWPGCYIPPIPRKKVINSNQFTFLQSRREGLCHFCQEISLLKHLWYSREFQVLIRGHQDVIKNLKEIEQQSYKQISQKYSDSFKSIKVKDCEQNHITELNNFHQTLKKISGFLQSSKQSTLSLLDAFCHNIKQEEILLKYIFPEYEKLFLSVSSNNETEGKLIFTNLHQERLGSLIQEWKKIADQKQIRKLYCLVEKQDREVDAFLEVYKSKQSYDSALKQHQIKQKDFLIEQNKLKAGKQSFFKAIMKSDIEKEKQSLQAEMDSNQQKIKILSDLSKFTTTIMVEYEIPRFKQWKISTYYQTIKTIAAFEINLAQIKEEISDCILQNPTLTYSSISIY